MVLPAAAHPLTEQDGAGPMDVNAAPTQKQKRLR